MSCSKVVFLFKGINLSNSCSFQWRCVPYVLILTQSCGKKHINTRWEPGPGRHRYNSSPRLFYSGEHTPRRYSDPHKALMLHIFSGNNLIMSALVGVRTSKNPYAGCATLDWANSPDIINNKKPSWINALEAISPHLYFMAIHEEWCHMFICLWMKAGAIVEGAPGHEVEISGAACETSCG